MFSHFLPHSLIEVKATGDQMKRTLTLNEMTSLEAFGIMYVHNLTTFTIKVELFLDILLQKCYIHTFKYQLSGCN